MSNLNTNRVSKPFLTYFIKLKHYYLSKIIVIYFFFKLNEGFILLVFRFLVHLYAYFQEKRERF